MKQMRSIGLAVLVTLMLLSMPGKAGHAKETPSPEWVTALPAAAPDYDYAGLYRQGRTGERKRG